MCSFVACSQWINAMHNVFEIDETTHHTSKLYDGRRLYQYNEDDFQFQFFNSMNKLKHGNKETLSI